MTTKTTHTPGCACDYGHDHASDCPRGRLIAMAPRMLELARDVERIFTRHGWCEGWEAPEASALREARAILRALDTPDAPCPVSRGKENGK